MIYLDTAATTKPKAEVVSAINKCLTTDWGNPSSIHQLGMKAKDIVDEARCTIADFIGAKPSEIIFTSGACESNSLAISGLLRQGMYSLITTNIEHKSIMNIADDYSGCTKIIPVDQNGVININALWQALKKCVYDIPVVSIQYANNEIGTIQDMAQISEVVHAYGGILHTDATQIIPDRKIDVSGIDMMSFSGQKLGAPKGIGVLYVQDGIQLKPLIYGAQEHSRRGGTENVPYIAGIAEAVNNITYPTGELRDYFVERILKDIPDSYLVGCVGDKRLKNNASICFRGVSNEYMVVALDQAGICVSSGSACNSGITKSYVLESIELGEDANSVVRFTFGDNTIEEIDYVVDSCVKIINRLRNK